MPRRQAPEVSDILSRYSRKLSRQIEGYEETLPGDEAFSKEYSSFRREAFETTASAYEKLARWAGTKLRIAVKAEDKERLWESINIAHLDVTPDDAASLSALITILFALVAVFSILAQYLITSTLTMSSILLAVFLFIVGFAISKPLSNFPEHIASRWRLRAGNQTVLCILYVVMYMRHTSNLEHAIKFAGEHIGNPLALDLRKIFWDVEVGKYSTIKESLDGYLERWRKWNLEFIEAFHLIESSLFEPSEERRLERLEKSLKVIIEGNYDRMLHFAHDVKSPITILHMLGIILPILGLIILPLMGTFLGVKWWHLALLYNVALPIMVYYMGTNILEKRPLGYAERNILEEEPQFKEFAKTEFLGAKVDPKVPAILIGFLLCFFGLTPLILHAIDPTWDISMGTNFGWLLDYRDVETGMHCETGINCVGPFGIVAAIIGLFFPLGLAIGIGTYYKLKTKKLIVIREKSKELEKEFACSLFQLGNRIGDGIPSELAFGKVAENMKGTPTGDFLNIVNSNIRRLGMSIRDAIFDPERGAILSFPSSLIESSMKVLVESARKGPKVVAQCLISISVYVEKIRRVSERLQDLLADITSSMKGQISFLTPMIAGVVVGIGSMITTIIGKLGERMSVLGGAEGGTQVMGGFENIQGLVTLFPTENLMPPYFFQIVVGIYVVEIVIILTILSNSIQNGLDKISEKHSLGKYLITSPMFYSIIALIVTIVFSFLAGLVAQMQ